MVDYWSIAIQALLLLVFLGALIRYLRSRDGIQGEISLMLGTLAVSVILPSLDQSFGISQATWLRAVGEALFLAQPYILLRLANRFTAVPRAVHAAAAEGLVLCWAVLAVFSGVPPIWSAGVFIVYFVAVDAYSSYLFLRSARRKGGVVRQRMLAIAGGTLCFVLAIAFIGLVGPLGPVSGALARLVASILVLLCGAAYLVGFTTPAWLRRRWQLPEISGFMQNAPAAGDVPALLEHLSRSALRVTGGKAVATGLFPDTDGELDLRWTGEVPPEVSGLQPLGQGALWEALREGSSGWSRELAELPPAVGAWAEAEGVREFFALPVGKGGHTQGLLLVLPDRGFLFAQDDAEILEQMARHTAVACENARLLDAEQRHARRLSTLYKVTASLIHPLRTDVLALEILEAVASVAGAEICELFVLEPGDAYLSRIARRPESLEDLRWPAGTGLPGEALQRGVAVASEDVRVDARFVRRDEALREGYRAMLALPLQAGGRKVGVITLIHKSERKYSPDEIELMSSLAAPIATALENDRLYTAARRRLRQLHSLHETALALTSELSMEQLLTKIADAARSLVDARYAAIREVDGQNRLVRFVTSGIEEEVHRQVGSPPEAHGLLGEVLNATLRVADIRTHPRLTGFPQGHPTMRSFLGVPIRISEAVLGSLYVADKQEGAEFSPDDEQVLGALAAHAAVAISNARLFTELNEAKDATLRANEELENASRAKSDFLASMSHELRTPLNAILGFTEIMLDDQASVAEERRRHYLETVHSSGRHLLGLINDILDLSKVEAGRMDLQLEDFDAALAIREVLSTVEPLAERGDVLLSVEASAPCRIRADRGKFKQILYNLVSNGIKFTPAGGKVQVQCAREGNETRLAVVDTGVGIAPEDRQRVFEAFQQVDGSVARAYEGTGLGLALVKRFAELHGGTVALESAPGEGSRFVVTFPGAVGIEVQTEPAALHPVGPAGAPLVLVVEDDPHALSLLRHTLQGQGFRIETARSGEEALAKAATLSPAAITLDVLLPGMDGWAVLHALKDDPTTRDVPVVVVTIVDDAQTAYALGATDFFVKPVVRQVLLDRLRRYIRSAPMRVLAVDDDPTALEVIAGILEPEEFALVTAQSGEEALRIARSERPDIVLLDLMMPGMSGFEVLEELRAQEATRGIPVLVLSARKLSEEDKRRLSGQVQAVIHKGEYAKTDLVQWMREALD